MQQLTQTPLLHIENLSVDFIAGTGTTPAVKNVSLQIQQGEIVGIVGESGSGKSVTSLSILQLLPSPPAKFSSGKILFNDAENTVDLLTLDADKLRSLRGNKIAMIFQEPMTSLNPVIKCGDQVVEALLAHKNLSAEEAKLIALSWFEKVRLPNPADLYHRYPHQLSGGQKQRVMIAMAMCCQPSLLICDEPTTALDVTVQKAILNLIKELQSENNMGVIFITHDLGVVADIADRVAIMYRGSIVEEGDAGQIFGSPQHPYTKALIACRPSLHARHEKLPTVADMLSDEPKKNQQRESQQNDRIDNETIVQVRNLVVEFPGKKNWLGKPLNYHRAVDDVSFEIFRNETLGLVGESGCGKTTLGRTLLRLVDPAYGEIYFKGTELSQQDKSEIKKLRRAAQLVFQDPFSSLNPRMTIGAAIEEAMAVHKDQSRRIRLQRVGELLELVDLDPAVARRYPHEFSGGQRQRVVIARALSLQPEFLVCDESVSALDVSVQAQVLNLLNDLKSRLGLTMLFISHDLSVVHYMCDRILVMQQGKIVEAGDAEQVYRHPKSSYTASLISAIPSL